MNILYLAHRVPYPPNKGDKLRAFRQIEHLAKRHSVWCAFFVDHPRDARHVHELRRWCSGVGAVELKPFGSKLRGLGALARGCTITEGYYDHHGMAMLLADWQAKIRFDAVFAFSSSMANYALQVSAPRRVLDLCDLDSAKWSDFADHIARSPRPKLRDRLIKHLYRIEGRRLAAAELRWVDLFDAAILVTEAEAAPLRNLVSPRKLRVIGNGVDLPELEPSQISANLVVGFVGVMDYFPNVDAVEWFARERWPALRHQFPTAVFRIVGRSPATAVRRLASIPGVEVVGEVDSIATELSKFDVSVAPLRIARGVQNKVLEAMAAAKPVVLTSQAAGGISAVQDRDYLIADTASQLAATITSLLGDPLRRKTIGEAARHFVATHCRWDTQLDKLDALIATPTPHSTARSRIATIESVTRTPLRESHQSQPTEQDQSAPA